MVLPNATLIAFGTSQTLRGPGGVESEGRAEGKEKELNWLPAPTGEFNVTMRIYWPKEAALDGKWKPPAVKQVQ